MKRLFVLILLATCQIVSAQVICDEFKINANLEGDILSFTLDTDLPDQTILMVSVGRSFIHKSSGSVFTLNFYDAKSSVEQLKTPHKIDISDSIFKASILNYRKKIKAQSNDFRVSKISDDIEVRIVVPVNQTNPKFGDKSNSKLLGEKVISSGLKIISSELRVKKVYGTKKIKMPDLVIEEDGFEEFSGSVFLEDEGIRKEDICLEETYTLSEAIKAKDITIPQGGYITIKKISKGVHYFFRVLAYDENLIELGVFNIYGDTLAKGNLSLHQPIIAEPTIHNKEIMINRQNRVSVDCIDKEKLNYDKILNYENVKIIKVSAAGIRMIHSSGVATIPLLQIPSEVREDLKINYKNALALNSRNATPASKIQKEKPNKNRWFSNQAGIMIFYSLTNTDGNYNLKRDFVDGGSLNTEVITKPSAGKTYIYPKKAIPSGDYWIIDRGQLLCMDSEGLICKAKLVK